MPPGPPATLLDPRGCLSPCSVPPAIATDATNAAAIAPTTAVFTMLFIVCSCYAVIACSIAGLPSPWLSAHQRIRRSRRGLSCDAAVLPCARPGDELRSFGERAVDQLRPCSVAHTELHRHRRERRWPRCCHTVVLPRRLGAATPHPSPEQVRCRPEPEGRRRHAKHVVASRDLDVQVRRHARLQLQIRIRRR